MKGLLQIGTVNISSHSARHNHRIWEGIYQLTGSATYYANNWLQKLHPGDIILLPPNVPHGDYGDNSYSNLHFLFEELYYDTPPDKIYFLTKIKIFITC